MSNTKTSGGNVAEIHVTRDSAEKKAVPDMGLNLAAVEESVHGQDLVDSLLFMCRHYQRAATPEQLLTGLPLAQDGLTLDLMPRAAARADLSFRIRRGLDLKRLSASLLPVMCVLKDGAVCILLARHGDEAVIVYPQMPDREIEISFKELRSLHSGVVGVTALLSRKDERTSDYGVSREEHWFWSRLKTLKWHFAEVAMAAALANILAVATSLYMRQIYDRVVPNLAFNTLWVLTIGVALAIVMETMLRIVRAFLMDSAGKRLDQTLSSHIFSHSLGMRLEARPKSTGSFVNQIREFDSVREFFTSSTIGTLTDIPFAFLFIGIIWVIGGPIAYVLMAALPLIVIPGLIAQFPLARYAESHMKEGSIRNGLLVEAMTSSETVKAIQAESRFQRLWEEYTWLLAKNGMRVRQITMTLTYSANAVQQTCYIMVIVVGVYQIFKGELSVGSMMACSILSSRAVAPMTQLAGILARYQQMRTALKGIDKLLTAPVDRPVGRNFVSKGRLTGDYRFDNVTFAYDPAAGAALKVSKLAITGGIGTALLGANGSGKSTMLKLMAGLYQVSGGSLFLDDLDIRQIEPGDLRRNIGYLPQDTRLFYGTLRENLLLGLDEREDSELLHALSFCGSENFVKEHPLGLDRMISEGGAGVSGGQRQSIGLARLWLRDPSIVLLDEPTASMDHALEMRVIENLKTWARGRTLIVTTHRQPMLTLVKRAVVMQNGSPVAEGDINSILASLSSVPQNSQPEA